MKVLLALLRRKRRHFEELLRNRPFHASSLLELRTIKRAAPVYGGDHAGTGAGG